MLAEAARKLEQEFERVALDQAIHPKMKARRLSCLLQQMFDDAIHDLRERAEHAHIRGDFVLDFVERADLAPGLLQQCFAPCAQTGGESPEFREVMAVAAEKKPELEQYMPSLALRWR